MIFSLVTAANKELYSQIMDVIKKQFEKYEMIGK